MPLQPKQLSAQETTVAREEAQPTVQTILNLLLRGGAACYLEFERTLLSACEVAYNNHRFTSTDGRVHFEKTKYSRVNPEDLKRTLRSCGVLLDAAQYKLLRVAYSDPVGFVLSDPFLSALCPLGQVPPPVAAMLHSALPSSTPVAPVGVAAASPSQLHQDKEKGTDGVVSLPDVTLDSALSVLGAVFAVDEGDESQGGADSAGNAFNKDAYEEALRVFSTESYPDRRLPGVAFANFVAAELLLLYSNSSVDDAAFASIVTGLEQRLAACAGQLEAAPSLAVQTKLSSTRGAKGSGRLAMPSAAAIAAATVNKDKTSSMVDFRMTHDDVQRRPHKFEYYMQLQDRRDEWLRGRQEKDSRSMYMRHTTGYGGHLPEFQYHFGRTFHVIEEDLPDLTKPKPPLEPLTADAFGKATVLKKNQMTEHHFSFA